MKTPNATDSPDIYVRTFEYPDLADVVVKESGYTGTTLAGRDLGTPLSNCSHVNVTSINGKDHIPRGKGAS